MKNDPAPMPDGQAPDAVDAEAILAAVSFATDRLLLSESWEDQIAEILQRLGEAANVTRAILVERIDEDADDVYVALRHVWAVPGVTFDLPPEQLDRLGLRAAGFARWEQLLANGQTIAGNADDFPASERRVLAAQGVVSLLAIPIRVGGTWWGYLGIDDTRAERQWPAAMIAGLATIGNMLGAAIERSQAQREAREGERRYRDLIEGLPVGIRLTSLNPDAPPVMANRAAAQIFGYDDMDEYLALKPIDGYTDPADRQKIIDKIISQGGVIDEEILQRRKDGTPVWIAMTSRPVYGDDGRLKYFDGSFRDITAQKQAEQALQDERELLQTIIDTIPDAVYLKDTEGRLRVVNQRYVDGMPGDDVTKETFIGHTDEEFFEPEAARQWAQRDQRIIRTGEGIENEEHNFINSFGQGTRTLNTIVPFRDNTGEIVGLIGVTRNVTIMMNAERALQSERELLRTVIDAIPDAVYLKDLDGKFLLGNRKLLQQYEYGDTSELLGKTDYDFFRREQADKWRRRDQRVMQTGEALLDWEHSFADGPDDTTWLSESMVPFHGPDGQVAGIVGIVRNVTEHRRAEQALRDERELLRTVFNSMSDALYIKDTESRFLMVNERFVAWMKQGTDAADYIGKTDYDFFDRELAERFRQDDATVMQTGEAIVGRETVRSDRDGNPAWAWDNLTPFTDSEGEVAGVVGIIRNITPAKMAEKHILEERQRLRQIIDTIPDAVYLKDRAGRYALVNQAFLQTRQAGSWYDMDPIGRTDAELSDSDRVEVWRRSDEQVMQGEPSLGTETTSSTSEGEEIWLRVSKAPYRDADGNVVGLVGVISDISEQKKVQQRLLEERHLLRQVIDTIPEAIYLKDTEGRYLVVNKEFAATRVTDDATTENCIGKTDFELEPKKAAGWWPLDLEVFNGTPTIDLVRVSSKPDGSPLWVLVNKHPLHNAEGQITGLVGAVRNITASRLVELSLRDEQQRLRTIIDTIPSALYMKDLDGRYVLANKAFYRGYGAATEAEIVGKTDYGLFTREKADHCKAQDAALIASGRPVLNREVRTVDAEGHVHWRLFNSAPIPDSEGRFIGLLGIVGDITEQKQAEQESRLKEAQFREVLNSSQDIAYRLDLNNLTYDYVGAAAEPLMGYTPDELTAMGFAEATKRFHPDDLKRLDRHFSALLSGGVEDDFSPTIEYRWRCRDDQYRWFSDSRSLVRDQAGQPVALVGAIRNITDRKLAEEALRDSEAKYRGVIESIPVGMCQIDPAAGGRIIMANPAAARMFGYESVEDMMQVRLSDLLPSARQRRKMLGRILREGQIVGEEVQAVRRDGAHLWVAATVQAVRDEPGNVLHLDALLEDITERKLAAQAVQEAHAKLVNARETERRRLATELHDSLGQSLVVLNLAVQSVYVGHDREFDPARLSALKGVADRCTDLIEEVRHICHGLFPPVLEALGLEAALRGIARDCQGQVKATLVYPDHLAGCRFGQSVEIVLYRIAQEAVQNALRHSQAKRINLALTQADGRVRLTITDNGRGFDVKTTKAKATGLGLTTMSERAQAVGGHLRIDSEPGRTRVTIEAPTTVIPPEPDESASGK